jgi:hypothetical protein
MTQAKATARPWRIAHKASDYTYIEQAGGNFLTIAKVTDVVERDANAELIVTAVNERAALLSEVAQLREALDNVLQCFRNGAMPDRSIIDAAESALAKER